MKNLSLVTVIIISMPLEIISCPIPVFRYALEYWDADPYSLEIIHDKPLTPAEEELVNYLQTASSDSEIKANMKVVKTHVEGQSDISTLKHLKTQAATFPLMVLRYPPASGINEIIWSGQLNIINVDLLLKSPARETISKSLVKDATALWILLESGDRAKDRAALDMLEKVLRWLEQTLVLPDPDLWWRKTQDGDEEPPEIKFEILRISRNDPREEPFIKTLMNSEYDLWEFESEPIVFPVFGRGIALYALVGKGINQWNIREAAEFLTGPCSCQAKRLNPGLDLLISMDWNKHVEILTDINIANPLTGLGDFSKREEETKRQLELATQKRMGSEAQKSETYPPGTGTLTPETGKITSRQEKNKENVPSISQHREPAETNKSKTTVNDFQKSSKINLLPWITGGIILLIIFLGVTILYRKT